MSIEVNRRLARAILYEEAAKAAAGYVDQSWAKPIEDLSTAATGKSLTHIAFLGTAILAKCARPDVDVFAVKERAGPSAYSARGLCHHVLVPNAPELDISLGVTGREPLNNQPYFRIERLTRDAPVRSTARGVLNLLCDILDRLSGATEEQARQALRAFIDVRRRHGSRYSRSAAERVDVSIDALVAHVASFVAEASEGGRRAQAVVAALSLPPPKLELPRSQARSLLSELELPIRKPRSFISSRARSFVSHSQTTNGPQPCSTSFVRASSSRATLRASFGSQ